MNVSLLYRNNIYCPDEGGKTWTAIVAVVAVVFAAEDIPCPLIVFNHCYDVLFSYNKPITILLIRLFITELFITLDDDDKYNPLFKQFVELIKWIWHIDRIEIDKCNYGTPTSLVFDSYRGRFKKMKITHIIQEYMYHLELKIFGNERLGRSSFIQLKGTVELT